MAKTVLDCYALLNINKYAAYTMCKCSDCVIKRLLQRQSLYTMSQKSSYIWTAITLTYINLI